MRKRKAKKAKPKMPKSKEIKKPVKVCPNCGDPNIEYASVMRESAVTITGFGLPEVYYCKNCGYEGSVILEVDKRDLKKIKFPHKIKKIKMNDKRSAEIMRPVFVVCILLFFIAAVVFFMPASLAQQPALAPENVIIIGDEQILFDIPTQTQPLIGTIVGEIPVGDMTRIEAETAEGVYYVYITPDDRVVDVQKATGIASITGFMFPLFLIFFVLGMLALMVYSQLTRTVHFHR
jgi:predicted RNA-binding Zn-ribbon protein involved in translation (DUF1610 family)